MKHPLIVDSENPKECFKCGEKIGFVKLKSGSYAPVNVHYESGKGYTNNVHYGNHNNMVPVHKCIMVKCKTCGAEGYYRKMLGDYHSEMFCNKVCYSKPIQAEIKRLEEMNEEYSKFEEEQKEKCKHLKSRWDEELIELKRRILSNQTFIKDKI